jgi:glycopeptide antibiotics resistance protein
MQSMNVRRLIYLLALVIVVVLGLASRHFQDQLPAIIGQYAGDTLWAVMVFLLCSFLAPRTRGTMRAALALAIAVSVELSQLIHTPVLDELRSTTLGHLVLGRGFVATDLICYALGVALGLVLDCLVSRRTFAADRKWPNAA